MDLVRPLKLEDPSTGGTQSNDYPTETDPTEDYLTGKGLAIEDENTFIDKDDISSEMQFTDTVTGTVKLTKLLNNTYVASVDPNSDDDDDAGFLLGQKWINEITQEIFVCVDNTNNSAVWVDITDSGGDRNVDGGFPDSVYLPSQKFDGGVEV